MQVIGTLDMRSFLYGALTSKILTWSAIALGLLVLKSCEQFHPMPIPA